MAGSRTSVDELQALAVEDLVAALASAGVQADRTGKRLLKVRFDDSRSVVEVVAAAYATGARVEELVGELRPDGHVPVLVADRVTADARDRLAEAGWGWLDRRGHLRLRSPGLLVDTDVSPATRRSTRTPEEPIRGRAGVAVAYRLLTRPGEPVSTTRSDLGFAPSTVSEALTRLRTAGLVDDDGLAVTPELFWVLAERWTPERTWLAEAPDPTASDAAGWCVTGTVAAAELGAPVVSTGGAPDLYVTGPSRPPSPPAATASPATRALPRRRSPSRPLPK